ncbi:hypothetical protein COHA_004828 [Chlorella ohadii]|uniref:DNA (cytosine-5-)-methyltransferase n=1 Tax=Chlorella ohadii TaxID=2649997 RepID=A0AAD5DS10_9CHLO|nr:hypothetical protein COHA_004828 [Chlorella ohadii]
MKVASLFSGAGGLDIGLHQAGHELLLLCESDAGARQVLRQTFPGVRIHEDVTSLERLPEETELLTAGFPCVDVSRAGLRRGLEGQSTGLVRHVFRLLQRAKDDRRPVPWVLLENVEALLDRHAGDPPVMQYCAQKFIELGYQSWSYRVVNSAGFGIPNRRRRVFMVASLHGDARDVLLSQGAAKCTGGCMQLFGGRRCYPCHAAELRNMRHHSRVSYALDMGNAMSPAGEDVVPTFTTSNERMLLLLADGASGMLRGLPEGHTRPCWPIQTPGVGAHRARPPRTEADAEAAASKRWDLLGNAVTTPVARWLGERLANPYQYKYHGVGTQDRPLEHLLVEGASAEATASLRQRPVHPWSYVTTDQLQDAYIFEYLSITQRKRENADALWEAVDAPEDPALDEEGSSGDEASEASGDEAADAALMGGDAEAAEALAVARAARRLAAAERAAAAAQQEQQQEQPEAVTPQPAAPTTPMDGAPLPDPPSIVPSAPAADSPGRSGAGSDAATDTDAGEPAAEAAGAKSGGSQEGDKNGSSQEAGSGVEAALAMEVAATPSAPRTESADAPTPAEAAACEAEEQHEAQEQEQSSAQEARATRRLARAEAEAEQKELFQAAIVRRKERGKVQQQARQQAWWDREAWPRAAWWVRGLGCFGCEEMSECPVPTPFVPLGDFIADVGREATQQEIHTYVHRMREKGWDVDQTIEKLLKNGTRISAEAHEIVRIPGLLTDADMIGDIVWAYDRAAGCWWPAEKLDPLNMPAGRDLPAGALRALSADEKLVSLPQYRQLASKVPAEQRQQDRRVLVQFMPISNGQWKWYRPSQLEAFDGNTEREREASNLIRSNGGRWKHSEEMVRALKDARASLYVKHNRNCLESERMRRTRASAAAGAINLKQRCGQCKTCMNNFAGQRRFDCLTQRMKAAALSGHAGAQIAINGEFAVGARVQVWWEGDQCFYPGLVALFDPVATEHTVCYDDGEVGMHRLWQHDERIRLASPVEQWPRDAVLARHLLAQAQAKLRNQGTGRRTTGGTTAAAPPQAPPPDSKATPYVMSTEELRRKNKQKAEQLAGGSPTAAEEDGAAEEADEEEAPRQTGRTRKRGRRASSAGGSEGEEEEDGGASSGGDASTEAPPPPPSKLRRITFEKCGQCKHCLNPKLKKACKVVMLQRQELGLRRRI